MADRKPVIRIPGVAKAQAGADLAGFASDAAKNPLASGRLIDATFAATNFAVVRHGLGRSMRGAIVVGSTYPHDSEFVAIVDDPNGEDPATWLTVSSNTAFTGTVRLWVF